MWLTIGDALRRRHLQGIPTTSRQTSHGIKANHGSAKQSIRFSGYGNFSNVDPDSTSYMCSNRIWQPLTTSIHTSRHDGVVKAGVVVSHCNQDISWLAGEIELLRRCRMAPVEVTSLHVYSKCGVMPIGIPSWASLIRLPNVGRCDHVYAYHLAETPAANLQDVTIFLKDSYYANRGADWERPVLTTCQFVSAAWQNGMGFGCAMSPRANEVVLGSAWHIGDQLAQFSMDGYAAFSASKDNSSRFESPVRPLGKWLAHIGVLPDGKAEELLAQKIVPVCFGGQFAVARQNILTLSQESFRKMESALKRGDNIEEGHYAERLWASILSSKPPWPHWEHIKNHLHELAQLIHPWPINGMLANCIGKQQTNSKSTNSRSLFFSSKAETCRYFFTSVISRCFFLFCREK